MQRNDEVENKLKMMWCFVSNRERSGITNDLSAISGKKEKKIGLFAFLLTNYRGQDAVMVLLQNSVRGELVLMEHLHVGR